MSRGPNRATLIHWAKVLGDDALFADAGDGWRVLVVGRRRLAVALGVTVGSVQDRLEALRNIGLARGTRRVELDRRRIEAAAGGRILPLEPPAAPDGDLFDEVLDDALDLLVDAARDGDNTAQNRALRVIHSLVKSARQNPRERADLEPAARIYRADLEKTMNEMSNSSSISSISSPRERASEIRAESPSPRGPSVATSGGDAVPAADRGFSADELGWDEDEMTEVLRPLQDICAGRGQRTIDLHPKFVAAARSWPKPWLERAVTLIGADCAGITQPGALLYRAMLDGRLRYFPLEPPGAIVPRRCDTPAMPPEPLAEEVRRIVAEMDAPPEEPLPMSDAIATMRSVLRHDREVS